MRVLLTGASGQVGKELIYTCPDNINLVPFNKSSLDISRYNEIEKTLIKHKPDIVINAAAYTFVDKAEKEQKQLAYEINSNAVNNLATICNENNIRLIHFSTDYVFNGNKHSPYIIEDNPDPVNVYGKSKLQGEEAALSANMNNTLVIRTSWIYSTHGHNFVKTMLKLLRTKETISVITDQIGCPTWARSIAHACWELMDNKKNTGIYHYSDSGETSWYEFAKTIRTLALEYKVIDKAAEIIPINTEDYNQEAKRPKYSVMDCDKTWEVLNRKSDQWNISLDKMLYEYGK